MDTAEARRFAALRVDASLEVIQALVPLNVGRALKHLNLAHERLVLLNLYQHYFPKQFARSTASPYLAPGNNGYSEAEGEFLQLAGRHLFPMAEAMDADERFDGIPIDPVGVPYEVQDDGDLPYVVLGACGGGLADAWPEAFAQWPTDLPGLDPVVPRGGLDTAKLEVLCNKRGGLFRNVPIALKVCARDTGNWFIDTDDENGMDEMPPWSLGMVETLRVEWAQADPLLTATSDLAKYLQAEPEAMIEVVNLLNAAVTPESRRLALRARGAVRAADDEVSDNDDAEDGDDTEDSDDAEDGDDVEDEDGGEAG